MFVPMSKMSTEMTWGRLHTHTSVQLWLAQVEVALASPS